MNDRINGVKAGTGIKAHWGNDLVDQVRRQNIIPGNGLKKSVDSKGTRLDLDIPAIQEAMEESGAVDSCFPVLVAGHSEGQAFRGVAYREVDNENSSNDRMYFPHVSPSSYYPTGCTVLAHRIETHTVESSND